MGTNPCLKLLLDQNLSPRLVQRSAALDIAASHVAHLGRARESDTELWRYAFENDAVVATINARDFILLAREAELHTGLIVLRRSRLSADGQWKHLEPALRFWLAEEQAGRTLINRVIEIIAVDELRVLDLPDTRS